MCCLPRLHWPRSALVLLLCALIAGAPALVARAAPQTYGVTRFDDFALNACAPNDCTLREAIVAANQNSGSTINLPAGTYTLMIAGAGEDAGATGDLDITASVTIAGAGATTIVKGLDGWVDRIVHVAAPGAVVNISGVTIQGGDAGGGGGGGILNQGTLTLKQSVVKGSAAGAGAGISNGGTLTLDSSTISGNTASGSGGGIDNQGALTLTNSTISGNTAATGGGVANANTATLSSVTVAKNSASGGSGGLLNAAGKTLTLKNSLIAGNSGAAAPDCSGALTSQGHNLIGVVNSACALSAGTGDITNKDAQIGPLRDNGGPTPTHALLASSRALDAGDPATPGGGTACPAKDQRGVQRPQTGRCDIGAFELPGVSLLNNAFQPGNLIVDTGVPVRWKNLDSVIHTTTSDTPGEWNGTLSPGEVFVHAFAVAGSYPYRSLLPQGIQMYGTITVVGEPVNLPPLLLSLDPETATAGSGELTLYLNGADFAQGAKVRWNNTDLTPFNIISSQIAVKVPANLLAAAGTAQVSVVNPDPG
ncbi:MAG TPA: choice-of-anchor Q domain-containing protein, partial [Roseiflexaceae bacterium]